VMRSRSHPTFFHLGITPVDNSPASTPARKAARGRHGRRSTAGPWKPLLGGLILLLLLVTSVAAGPVEELSAEGDRAYRQGDYEAAITAYEKLLAAGYTGGDLLYNLGNACYKAGRLGKARLYYERAAKLLPHDRDLRFNRRFLESRTVDRIAPVPRLPIWNALDSLRDSLPPRLLAAVTWTAATLAALALAAGLLVSTRRLRRALRYSALTFAVLFALSLGLLSLRIAADLGPPGAIIQVDKVVVRSAPDPTSQDLFHLHEGTKVTVLKEVGAWLEVRLADGRQGWMPRKSCEYI